MWDDKLSDGDIPDIYHRMLHGHQAGDNKQTTSERGQVGQTVRTMPYAYPAQRCQPLNPWCQLGFLQCFGVAAFQEADERNGNVVTFQRLTKVVANMRSAAISDNALLMKSTIVSRIHSLTHNDDYKKSTHVRKVAAKQMPTGQHRTR